jgi:hypothetical protein
MCDRITVCLRCRNARWVCEAHPDRPWGIKGGCPCGGPGDPCPVCNNVDEDEVPELAEDFVITGKSEP